FAKVRKVNALLLSWISAGSLKPERYREEIVEDGVRKVTDARFGPNGDVAVKWEYGENKGADSFSRQGEALDALSIMYYLRAADLRPGQTVCFDLVANRRYWRLKGTVAEKTEKVECEAGSFETLRLDGVAVRADGGQERPIHLWIGTDPRRLPIAAVSEIDL